MKKGTMKEKQTSKYKGFYTAIGISILMIGAACVYAYQVTMETNQTLENELSQMAEETQPTTNFIAEIYDAVTTTQPEYDAVAKVKTDVPVETTTEAVEETEPQEEPESEPEETEELAETEMLADDETPPRVFGTLNDDYILPECTTRYYTVEELRNISPDELWIAKNEIYARHGRMFKDQDLNNYFRSKSWYKPVYTPEQFDAMGDSVFNSCELANRDVLLDLEQVVGE